MDAPPNMLPFAKSVLNAFYFNTNIYSPKKVHTDICFKKGVIIGNATHTKDYMMLLL